MVTAIHNQTRGRDEFIMEIRERLLQVQAVMKDQYDQNHCQVDYAVGQRVW